MPVYNGAAYLPASMESILNQTFTNFEFIIVDDHSQDNSVEILEEYCRRDDRVTLIRNEKNLGIAKSLNKAIGVARGEFIARMDGDDISMPERFKLQVEYLDAHPEVGILGADCLLINERGEPGMVFHYPKTDVEIRWHLLFNNAFCHPCTMFRATMLQYGLYNEKLQFAQDYDLFSRFMRHTKGTNLDAILLHYRLAEKNVSVKYNDTQFQSATEISQNNVNTFLDNNIFSYTDIFKLRNLMNQKYLNAGILDENIFEKWIYLFRNFYKQFHRRENLEELKIIKIKFSDEIMGNYFGSLTCKEPSLKVWINLLLLFPKTTLKKTFWTFRDSFIKRLNA